MESKRQLKFARLFQKEIADIFQKEGYHNLDGGMITITKVKVTPDISTVRVLLSFFKYNDIHSTLEQIQNKSSEIRFKLGNKIKNQVRIVPHIEFFIDDTNEYVAKMDKLFDEINKDKN